MALPALLGAAASFGPCHAVQQRVSGWLAQGAPEDPRIVRLDLRSQIDGLAQDPAVGCEQLARLLALLQEARPRGFVFDLAGRCQGQFCSCRGLPGGDPVLAQLRRLTEPDQGIEVVLPTRLEVDEAQQPVRQIPGLQLGDRVPRVGFANMPEGTLVTHVPVILRVGTEWIAGLGLEAARLAQGLRAQDVVLAEGQRLRFGSAARELTEQDRLRIRFRRLPRPFPAEALLRAPVPLEAAHRIASGRVLLLGSESPEDRWSTPLGLMSGLELQAQVAHTLLLDDSLTELPWSARLGLPWMLAALLLGTWYWPRPRLRLPVQLSFLVGWPLLGLALLRLDVELPLVGGAVTLGLAWILGWLAQHEFARLPAKMPEQPDVDLIASPTQGDGRGGRVAQGDLDQQPNSLVGMVLGGRYKILRQLGKGAQGSVFLAQQLQLERQVAIKVIQSGWLTSQSRQRFRAEAHATCRVKHPHVVEIYDFDWIGTEQPYIVMEYIEGCALASLLEQGRVVPWRRTVHLGIQMAEALAEAHRHQVVHRDLKPANVLLTTRGTDPDFVKLVDFGIAKLLTPINSNLTGVGTMLGTPAYMAPEQIESSEVGPACDIYALGVVLFQMLSGKLPIEGADGNAILVRKRSEPPSSLEVAAPHPLPDPLRTLVMMCLERRSQDRPPSCAAIVAVLRGLLTNDRFPASTTGTESGERSAHETMERKPAEAGVAQGSAPAEGIRRPR